jgi:gamma-butyrobetaine dioxygenase
MKIELVKNKVYFISDSGKKEIHPFWLRERVNGEEFLDKNTQQRLFDPTSLNSDIAISKANISDDCLIINFNDGVNSKLNIEKIALEFSNEDNVIKSIDKIKWNSDLKNIKNFEYQDNLFDSKEMHDLLISFYQYGFVIIKNVPTHDNFIVKFANSIGSVRRTNFGEHFNVKSKPDPNDLAYTSLALAPHTDNPYRNPVPCIQLLHCVESKVHGGLSTLVDGLTVTEDLKKENPEFYKILSEVKVRFKFIDKDVVLEDWSD